MQTYLLDRSRRVAENVRDLLPAFRRMLRKPAILRVWILTAHNAQVALLAVLLILPTVVPAGLSYALEKVYPPVTTQHLLGLMTKTVPDPRVKERQRLILALLWIGASGVTLLLLWTHIPAALVRAAERSRKLEAEADSMNASDPSRSAELYRSAAGLVADPKREREIEFKLESVTPRYTAEIAAVAGAPGNGSTPGATAGASPDKTVLMPESRRSGLPVAAIGADGRYVLEAELGRGAMGIVYRARDVRLDRPVALKQLFSHRSEEAEALHRFRQEARVLARLSHPNIVQVYDFIEEAGSSWIAMELVDGEDLEWRLSNGALSIEETLRRGSEIADALGYAHETGVVHRDFKPGNVLVDGKDRCKISDFGIAKLSESSVNTQSGTILGSPAFMSPEQAKGDEVDARTDIYALGVTLFLMATGAMPFKGDTRSVLAQVLTKEPPAPRSLKRSVPKALDALILRMLAKKPSARPQSMAEVKTALEEIG